MKREINEIDNILLPILFSTLGIVIRMLHDKYEGRLDQISNYILRLSMGIVFTITSSFLIDKDIYIRNIDLYGTCMFLIGLFGMEISLFLLDKQFMKSLSGKIRKVLLNKIK